MNAINDDTPKKDIEKGHLNDDSEISLENEFKNLTTKDNILSPSQINLSTLEDEFKLSSGATDIYGNDVTEKRNLSFTNKNNTTIIFGLIIIIILFNYYFILDSNSPTSEVNTESNENSTNYSQTMSVRQLVGNVSIR